MTLCSQDWKTLLKKRPGKVVDPDDPSRGEGKSTSVPGHKLHSKTPAQ